MGRFITPRGVVVEMNDKAAEAVGFKPADRADSPTSTTSPAPAKRPRGRPRKKPLDSSEEAQG